MNFRTSTIEFTFGDRNEDIRAINLLIYNKIVQKKLVTLGAGMDCHRRSAEECYNYLNRHFLIFKNHLGGKLECKSRAAIDYLEEVIKNEFFVDVKFHRLCHAFRYFIESAIREWMFPYEYSAYSPDQDTVNDFVGMFEKLFMKNRVHFGLKIRF